jgi:hypothetical protein
MHGLIRNDSDDIILMIKHIVFEYFRADYFEYILYHRLDPSDFYLSAHHHNL